MNFELIVAFVGLLLSLYAYRVTMHLKRVPTYAPLCEISNRVSCKRAFIAKESHLFLIPNSGWGMIYYFLIILLVENYWLEWALYLSTIALAISLFLAYLLYFKQKNFCVVCWATHLVNLCLFASFLYSVVI